MCDVWSSELEWRVHSGRLFFWFKRKTAYEMRISDWSSDVCSSDVHVAPLAGRSQVARGVVGRIMVEVDAGDIDPRDTDDRHEVYRPDPDPPSAPVSPLPTIHVPPPSVAQGEYALTMRAMAMLAPPIGAAEANGSRQLGPVDRVKPAMFGHDRHDDSMSQRERERKQKIT